MRMRLVPLMALFGLLAALPALAGKSKAADDAEPVKRAPAVGKGGKSTLVVRIKALDELMADGRYLFDLAGKSEEGKQLEKMLKARTGPKGLDGFDTKKPIGLYGNLKSDVKASEVVLLLPIADEKAFLDMLENLDVKPEKDKGGLYTANVENVPFPVIFRFANGYLYGTLKSSERSPRLLDKGKLPLPAAVLGAGGNDLLSVTLNIDQIPNALKDVMSGGLDVGLDQAKEQEPPDETPAGKAFREALVDEFGRQLKAVIREGASLRASVNVDRKAGDLSMELELKGKSGSALSKDLAALGALKSVGASLVSKASAANSSVSVRLPAAVRKQFAAVVDENFKKALDKEADKDKRELARILLDALAPTAKAGALDFGFDLRGPSKGGKYGVVVASRVTDGEAIEKAVKKLMAKVPDEVKEIVTLDVEKVGDVHVHRITAPKGKIDENTREVFGEGPAYFAVSKDAIFLALGEGALPAIKGALAAPAKVGHPFQGEVSLARIAKLMAKTQKAAPDAAQKAFKARGSDKVRFTVEAGDSLQIKFGAKAQVVTFLGLLDKAKEAE